MSDSQNIEIGILTVTFSLEDLRQSESVSSFREDLSRVSSEWSYEKQRLKEVMEDKSEAVQGLFFRLKSILSQRSQDEDDHPRM